MQHTMSVKYYLGVRHYTSESESVVKKIFGCVTGLRVAHFMCLVIIVCARGMKTYDCSIKCRLGINLMNDNELSRINGTTFADII